VPEKVRIAYQDPLMGTGGGPGHQKSKQNDTWQHSVKKKQSSIFKVKFCVHFDYFCHVI
jgi:hypothetical protein